MKKDIQANAPKRTGRYNICNVHYAPITVAEEGTVSFGTPVAMPGAVSISMDPTGEPESFYADGIEYYVINNNQGYDGDLELAMIPESFRTDILREEQDANKVLVENANSETGSFALLFEFDGDIRKMFCCFFFRFSGVVFGDAEHRITVKHVDL